MDRYTYRAEIIRALKGTNRKLDDRKKPATFRCSRHDDKTPSAWLGDHAWGCFACGFEEPLDTLGDELGVERPRRGLSLEDYADRKGFAIDNLQRWGVHTATGKYDDDVVMIPYRDAGGALLRSKYRTNKGTFWHNDGHGTHLYGLDMLAKQPEEPVILVEGESDCHAAWSHGVLAVGLPGASQWRSAWKEHLTGRDVYIWQEPDEAGAKMVRAVAADLPEARIIEANGVKDLADLHKQTGKDFKKAIRARMAEAIPVGKTPPSVPYDVVVGPTLERLLQKKLAPIDAVPTCLPTWNSRCRDSGGGVGLARGWHITIGAKTGAGKSLLALNLMAAAMRHGERVAFHSLEMSQEQLITRLLAIVSGQSVRRLEQGSGFDIAAYRDACRAIEAVHAERGGVAYVNRARLSKLEDIVDAMRWQWEVNGCRYHVVDYLQLAYTLARMDEYERVQEVSHTVRDTAAKLGVISVGLSQFNRETSRNNESPPTPQGLHGGSALENDSDQVALLDHSTHKHDHFTDTTTTRLLLAKNRHGGLAAIDVRWNYRDLTLHELTKQEPVGEYPPPSSHPKIVPPENSGEAWEPAQGDLSWPPDERAA